MRYAWFVLSLLAGTATAAQDFAMADSAVAPAAATGVTVFLREQGISNEDEVRLGEIAQITGPAARVARLMRLPVARAPEPGQRKTMLREDVETVLRASPDGLIGVTMSGSDRTQLRAASQVIEGDRLSSAAVQGVEQQLASRPDIRSQIEITHVPVPLNLRPGEVEFRPELRSDELPNGVLTVKVRVFKGLRCVAETSVGLRVKLSQMVPVAAQNLPEGSILAANDVSMESREVSLSRWEPADGAKMVGRSCRQAIARGKVLEARMFEAPTVIRRGERVRLLLTRGALTVTTQGEARSDAAEGQTVRVRLPDSGAEVLGTATGPSEAKL